MNLIKIALLSIFLIGCGETDRGKAYITSQEGGISVIDLNTMAVINKLNAGGYPRGIGITKDGSHIITANKSEASITVTNKKTNEIEQNIEVGINPEFVRVLNDQVFV